MASGFQDYTRRFFSAGENLEQKRDVYIGSSDSISTFSQKVKSVLIYNNGSYAIHFNVDAAATTSHFKIPPKSWLMIDVPVTVVHLICATGETSNAYIIGIY